MRKFAIGSFSLLATAVLVAAWVWSGAAAAGEKAALKFDSLDLRNNWSSFYENREPGVAIDDEGIVHLRGAIKQATGTDSLAFVLPKKYTPSGSFYVITAGFNFTTARLLIGSDGKVYAESAPQGNAQQFTQLDSISYPRK